MLDIFTFIIDFILHIDQYLIELVHDYDTWIYAILFAIIFCETGFVITPFLPGDSLLFAASALAALNSNSLNIYFLVMLLVTAAILGDAINYLIGKYFGKWLFSRPDSRIFKQSYLTKTQQFYQKYGGKTIILARFMPIIRTFAPFVAGMGKMHYSYFIFFNIIGALCWVGLCCGVGYFFGNAPYIQANLHWLILAIIAISLLPIVIEFSRLFFSKNKY